MAKAAYCAACGANVYLNDDGLCPQGHGPENLSNHYEAPDLTPADQAQYDATAPVEKRKTSKALIIVLVILGLLVLCGVGACVFGVIGFSQFTQSAEEALSDVTAEEVTGDIATDEIAPDNGTLSDDGASDAPFDAETEIPGLTTAFFPGFSATTYYLIGEETDEPLTYQVVAYADDAVDFRIIFTALRHSDAAAGADDDPLWYWDTGTGAVWERAADYESDTGVSVADFAGTDAVVDPTSRAQIMSDFIGAHPGKVMSDFAIDENGRLGLKGIDESVLDDWMGDATTFESWWELDASAQWVEAEFSE